MVSRMSGRAEEPLCHQLIHSTEINMISISPFLLLDSIRLVTAQAIGILKKKISNEEKIN